MASKIKVMAGSVAIGGGAMISVQSMTNTRTADVEATAAQINSLARAGADIVRFAIRDADDAKVVRALKERTQAPLVADIHFDHRLAIMCAENGVDKLRINPGNIGAQWKVRELASCAKAHGIPIRIGINSGCMEKELLERYNGPTPAAMAESALNNAAMLERWGFSDIVLSAKSSSVRDTVEVYELLDRQCGYPLHIGVTEAGGGDMGLVKSSAGAGALLIHGIGDTLRFSLTGDTEKEAEGALMLLRALGLRREGVDIVSCPTCGRCLNVAGHDAFYERVKREFRHEKRCLKAAVMGCAVNGPGEAREADIGIAYGKNNAVLFKRGKQEMNGSVSDMEERFIKIARELIEGEE